jgi:hypothetical protein
LWVILSSNLHLQIIAHLTEGATGIADPKVVDPTFPDATQEVERRVAAME